ncbi:peptidoglycan recognition protein family protein [Hoyosella sp. YIM 151337]|uniref:peptidoglycan recognition protein family protein n=1 Tax=Hoyosella sp. YIM 151337 TaxID=2992742 RepID=UPI002235C630|nr:peptidoglycan recognition family protein [Hoyosella sp. YIM 151337]MCW4355280.1 peptidoglycan recognition protein family protein [Hoyosella sp. YIM 151337]
MAINRRGFVIGSSIAVAGAAAATTGTPAAFATPRERHILPIGHPVEPPEDIDFVGVTFSKRPTSHARIRFSADGSPSDWVSVRPSSHCPDWHPYGTASDLVPVPPDCTSIEVQNDDEAAEATPIAISGLQSITSAFSQTVNFLSLPVITRAGWGAEETLGRRASGGVRWSPSFSSPQIITVHHSAIATARNAAATVRAIHRYHTATLGWGDIGYHLLIDPAGSIYAGRSTGNALAPVFADGDSATDRLVVGGHSYAFNEGNLGICLLGDFTSSAPTQAARETLVSLLAALCSALGLDPEGHSSYVNPGTGATAQVWSVAQHRELNSTSCPGDAVAMNFSQIRTEAARRLRTGASTSISNPGAQASASSAPEVLPVSVLEG